MKKWSVWLEWTLRPGFAALLIYAGIEKIIHPLPFAQDVENYRLFGKVVSEWSAVWVPALECIVGLLLITGFWKRSAAFVNLCLMIFFLIFISQAAIRGLDIECGCFGQDGQNVGPLKVFENVLLLTGSLVLIWVLERNEKERAIGTRV